MNIYENCGKKNKFEICVLKRETLQSVFFFLQIFLNESYTTANMVSVFDYIIIV